MAQICPIYLIFHRLVQIVNEKEFEIAFELVNKLRNLPAKNKAFSNIFKFEFFKHCLFSFTPFTIKIAEMNLLLTSMFLKEVFLHL